MQKVTQSQESQEASTCATTSWYLEPMRKYSRDNKLAFVGRWIEIRGMRCERARRQCRHSMSAFAYSPKRLGIDERGLFFCRTLQMNGLIVALAS